ncbi:Pentatricopeptide repeat-containing protein [Spatholobus suberectus]|nr:Pentatricopeptide repeat-containing protein [Spatholobus suberectus]
MMRMYVQIGRPLDALNLFVEMLELGQTLPEKFTYPVVIKACGDLSLIDVGVGIHGQTLKYGFDSDTFVQNTLLAMYMNAGEKKAAQLAMNIHCYIIKSGFLYRLEVASILVDIYSEWKFRICSPDF